tara:strand:+ start:1131 stop:1961 length:831 start_codon:yes stop_codon:yes gene_type:complete
MLYIYTIKEKLMDNNTNLKDKISIITGAAGFIGSSIAHKLARNDSNLVLIDLNEKPLSMLKKKILRINKNINIDIFGLDLSAESERKDLIKNIKKKYKKINILVNSIGMVGTDTTDGWNVGYANQSLDAWNKAIDINLTSIFFLIQGLHKIMSKTKNASIINISSIYGVTAPDWNMYKDTDIYNPAAYSVSKSGLINMTKWLASTLAPNIRVNCISPGGVKRNQKKNFIKKYTSKTLLKRMANESDISDPVLFLASDMSLYVTGHNLIVDGGFTIK